MSGKITIHQAICGEKNKSWDLLKTTLTNRELAKNMALKTDIQDTAGGYKWDPSVRGFAYGDYYLIMRSFLDTGEVRPGRAFSHVLIIALSDLDKIPDLGVLFSLLPEKIDKEQPLVPLEPSLKAGEPIIDIEDYSNAFAGRFKKLLNGYFNMASHKNTIVWIGYGDYEKAVAEFWKRITIQEKHNFELIIPPVSLCTDNAAMIGWAAIERFKSGYTSDLNFSPKDRWSIEDTL
ncbi:MAG: hypothetical protein EOO85_25550 [Pedobacter sp.]|nr:MAG: hypothetical protein EOO85_25550 [Pedobacter sp.]